MLKSIFFLAAIRIGFILLHGGMEPLPAMGTHPPRTVSHSHRRGVTPNQSILARTGLEIPRETLGKEEQ